MLYDTPEKLQARQAEFDQEHINGLKKMENKQMAAIIAQSKYGVDVDYQPSDNGETPKGK